MPRLSRCLLTICFVFLLNSINSFARLRSTKHPTSNIPAYNYLTTPSTDTVVLSGLVSPKDANQYMPSYIIVRYYDLYKHTQLTISDSIRQNGKFHLKFPLTNPEEILISFGERMFNVYAFPGDSLSLCISFPANTIVDDMNDLTINFSGTHESINRELNQYWKLRRPQLSADKSETLLQSDSLFEFKRHRLSLMIDDLKCCQEYAQQNNSSELFSKIVSSDIKFETATALLQYSWRKNFQMVIPLDDEYLDFLKIINPNITASPLTQAYTLFIHALYSIPHDCYYKEKRNRLTFTERLQRLVSNGIELSERDSILSSNILNHAKEKDYNYLQDSTAIEELHTKYKQQFLQISKEIMFERNIEKATLSLNLIQSMCGSGLATDLLLLRIATEKKENGIVFSREDLKSLQSQIQTEAVCVRVSELSTP